MLEACVDPLKVSLPPPTQQLVVDGLITNDSGPYEVKLSYTTSFSNNLRVAPVNAGASIWIYDNFNNVEKLTEVSPGIYRTSKTGIQGQVGREYYIKIKTKFGREYQTTPQRLNAPGELANVTFQFDPKSILGANGNPGNYVDALKIIIDSKGAASGDLLRWRWNTIFKARTWPEFRSGGEGPAYFPSPEKCSGYVYRGGRCDNPAECPTGVCYMGYCLEKVAECTCCECWPYNYSTRSLISHNGVTSSLDFKEINLGSIPVGTQEFYEKYYINVEQLSLSEEVYDFWNLVEKSQTANGNIFQPNSVKVKGNIQPITDPNEVVLGIFGVSGITRKELYLNPEIVPYPLPPLDSFKRDCSQCFKLNYKEKPSFW
ncbi:MAG TPA: DUF4249 domain-containing protein [Cyclobacteriaceae bacterium]|nr:DUF4249 domain-containing protein [Cyclobacteriaceae bacterium]